MTLQLLKKTLKNYFLKLGIEEEESTFNKISKFKLNEAFHI